MKERVKFHHNYLYWGGKGLKCFTGRKGVKNILLELKDLMKQRVKFHHVFIGEEKG